MNPTPTPPPRSAWSWILQALFLGYVLIFALPLSEAAGEILFDEDDARNCALGVGLILLLLVGAVGSYWRIRAVRHRVRQQGKDTILKSEVSTTGLLYTWLCYLVVGVILAMTAMEAISGDINEERGLPPWGMAVLIPWILFGLVIFAMMVGAPENDPPVPPLRQKIADLAILLYQCVAYTIAWSTLFGNVKIASRGFEQGLDLFATALCFSFICSGIYFVNVVERAIDSPDTPRWIRWLTTLLICVCALWPVLRKLVG